MFGNLCYTWLRKYPFCDFYTVIRCNNLLLKGTKHHLSPLQLCTQIEANLSPELLSAYDQYKEKHDSDSDSDIGNQAPDTDDGVNAVARGA
jgi:hypothetical protein